MLKLTRNPLIGFTLLLVTSSFSNIVKAISLDDSKLRRLHETMVNHLTAAHAKSLYPSGGLRGGQLALSVLSPPTYKATHFTQTDVFFPDPLFRINFSKGLLRQLDIGLSWLPYWGGPSQGYGAWFQWLIIEASDAPLGLISVFSWNQFHHQSSLQHQVGSIELAVQYTGVQSWYYFGFAQQQHRSTFQGGPDGITLSAATEYLSSQIIRPYVGGGYRISPEYQWGVEFSYIIAPQWVLQWMVIW